MMSEAKKEFIAPKEMQVLISKLFGESSKMAHSDAFNTAQCRDTFAQIVDELYFYMNENVKTDRLHREMLVSGLVTAKEALKEKDFYLRLCWVVTKRTGDRTLRGRRKGNSACETR